MDKLKQAIRQVLDTLERLPPLVRGVKEIMHSITALREALDHPEREWPSGGESEQAEQRSDSERTEPVGSNDWKRVSYIRETLNAEQAEQEPVAWRWPTHNGYAYAETHFDDEGGEPLYTAPVRTKELTDDEISDVCKDIPFVVIGPDYDLAIARAVIAADRSKNRG